MKLKVLVFLAFASSAASAMDKPSWAQALWESTKEKFMSFSHVQNQLERIEYNKRYNEVKKIVKKDLTVREVETKKLRDEHQRILNEYKKCASINDTDWDTFLRSFKAVCDKNGLLEPSQDTREKMLPKKKYPYNLDQSNFKQFSSECILRKLKKRNLNPSEVEINYSKEDISSRDVNGEATQEIDGEDIDTVKIKNILSLKLIQNTTARRIKAVIDHEITHLKENHILERRLLPWPAELEINGQLNSCIVPLLHHQELEADGLYALTNIKAARNQYWYNCAPPNGLFFDECRTHPSDILRCERTAGIYDILNIEKKLTQKYQEKRETPLIQKSLKHGLNAFDPAFNC